MCHVKYFIDFQTIVFIRILVGGCITYSECTYVLSKSFQTKRIEIFLNQLELLFCNYFIRTRTIIKIMGNNISFSICGDYCCDTDMEEKGVESMC